MANPNQRHERVHFRFLKMPCCGFLYCNVNPRLPSYCPECGKNVIRQLNASIRISDPNAELNYKEILT